MTIFNDYKRKPNSKQWTCPLDGKIMNSRGAPSYLRNKHGISWDHKFLENPSLISNGIETDYNSKLFLKIKALFFNIKMEDTELNRRIFKVLYKLHFKLRFAIFCKRYESISRTINKIESIVGPVK